MNGPDHGPGPVPGRVTVEAPAKVNLLLGVGPPRADGFHTLATVYQAIGLHDEVTVASASTTTLTVTGEGVEVSEVPTDASNLALRAAAALAERAGLSAADAGLSMSIRKRIPVAGGMAGGSADAAAALLACDVLWGLRAPREDLLELAAGLGSDVPFALVGGTALGTGRGEVVSPLEDHGSYWWVVALPGGGLSTPAVYAEFDRLQEPSSGAVEPKVPSELLRALAGGDAHALAGELRNDLQPAALALRPELSGVLALGRAGALATMLSGSGPTCVFLAEDEQRATLLCSTVAEAGVPCVVARGPVPGARVVTAPVVR